MPYIHLNKETNKYRLFGSLPVMCKECNLDYTHIQYAFRNDKKHYENEKINIFKVKLERGGNK